MTLTNHDKEIYLKPCQTSMMEFFHHRCFKGSYISLGSNQMTVYKKDVPG